MVTDQNISPEEFELIENYLLQQMTPSDATAFALRLSTEPELVNKVTEVRLLMLGVQEATLVTKLDAFHKELPVVENKPGTGSMIWVKQWLMAAAILVVIAVGAWLFSGGFSKEEQLFSKYYKPDPGLISAMSTSDNYIFDRAMIDYKTGRYDLAITAWRSLLPAGKVNDTLSYFLGSAHLAVENNDSAISYLSKITAMRNSYFLADAHWYLGLALLKAGRKNEAVLSIKKSAHNNKAALLKSLAN